jgi:glycosyltransferase involved in cell wall biosynthesis
VSRHTAAETTRRLGVPSERISICSPGRPDWPRRTDEPADGAILFLGTLEARKNLGALVDAYARLVASGANPPRLVLAGRQTDESAELVARAGRPPLVGRVEFPGYVEPRDRQALYRQALVLVMPSHLEGFGIPALEAMTCGVPVIAADRGALPEVVGQAGILVNPEEPAAIAAALGQVLGDRGQRDRMREAGWIEAARYTWRDTARTVRDAWRLAIEARDTRRE